MIGAVWLWFALIASPVQALTSPTYSQILKELPDSDWVAVPLTDLLYMDMPAGRVVIQLAPSYAPHHADNLRALARAHYFDGSSVTRVQDDYVTQWGNDESVRALPAGVANLAPEFDRPIARDLAFTSLKDGDVYAPSVGFSQGFPVARNAKLKKTWLAHCYGMVGVGRDMAVNSGSGAELYVVTGHAPRHLDRNVSLVGRVLSGMELLSALPRGTEAMGFYSEQQSKPAILSVRLAADLPAAEQVTYEVINSQSAGFARLVEARRNRHDEFFRVPAGRIDLCNVPLPSRVRPREITP